ncbi:MAG: 50S ribosomal protein L23 [Victivallales bacterium]|nr:50S ribosomal protein L23 [Victivallales bacterium]
MKNPFAIVQTLMITERSMEMKDGNKYIFKVARDATKFDIRDAVESIYEVKVGSVNVMNRTGKKKRVGKSLGRRPNWKKAVVTLSDGSIDII